MKLKYYQVLEVWKSLIALRKQKLKSFKAVQALDDTFDSVMKEIQWLKEMETNLLNEYAIFEDDKPKKVNGEYQSDKKEEWINKRIELLDTESRELIPLPEDFMDGIIDFSMSADESSALKLIIRGDIDGESNSN